MAETFDTSDRNSGTVLVLGGGGARGLAHLGVLQVLESAGIRIDRVVGVSIGAFIGAAYCSKPDARAITEDARRYVTSERFRTYYRAMTRASKKTRTGAECEHVGVELQKTGANGTNGRWFEKLRDYWKASLAFHRVVSSHAILTNRPMADCLDAVIPNNSIESLQIPLTIVAADLRSGDRVHIETGDLHSAVLGSTALPGIFPPVEREGRLLADYGVLCSTPVATAMQYRPARIIAVDLTPELQRREAFTSGLEILNRMEEIGCFLFKEHIAGFADVMIKPSVTSVDWADFHDMDRVVEKGIIATEAVLPTLSRLKTGA